MSWTALRADLASAGSDCAWSDFGGFHFAPADALPEVVPSTTHLWAWDTARAVRVRIDVDRALVACLNNSPPAGVVTEEAHVRERAGHPWSANDEHVGRPDVPLPQDEFTLLELTGATRAVFVRQP
ncbi:hypothetical protein E1265_23900 [Streptomyces sp. 8K308]|uniref:hypothetical protein n=1 Tax=Streptomyces sp. 8K308 TaxID=2530388 RepID=UPI00104DF70C|nr:hypothetical protein [Streptomyces sp. 8K308]TDC19420.1 hypothetical protein E1265_23900 [Streptomyces sp. 8K308]